MPFLGRNWLDILSPNWRDCLMLNSIKTTESILEFRHNAIREITQKYKKLFDDDLTKPIKDFVVDIQMSSDVRPFEKAGGQLDKLEKIGILEKVAEWASPMVVVVKTNKDLRICIDWSVRINPFIETHLYTLPVIDELLANF